MYEIKDANKTHTVKGEDIDKLFKRATKQGKGAEYVVYFQAYDLTLSCRIEKGMS